MSLFEILLLAILQGITEFLPVSSSGHLVIVEALLQHSDQPQAGLLALNVVLHVGTLLSIVVFYWRRIWQTILGDWRLAGLIALASIPAAAAGLTGKLLFSAWFESPLLAGAMLPVTGLMLLWIRHRPPGQTSENQLNVRGALVVGCMQALAILPGISRSGATISAGLSTGLKRESAAAFSFLLAIPVIAGAGLLEAMQLARQTTLPIPLEHLALGASVSFVTGLLALRWLIRWLQGDKLHYFAWWCIPVGLGIVAWQLWLGGEVERNLAPVPTAGPVLAPTDSPDSTASANGGPASGARGDVPFGAEN